MFILPTNQFFFFCANYCVILLQILVDATVGYTVCRPAEAFIFYSGHPDVFAAIIINVLDVSPRRGTSLGTS